MATLLDGKKLYQKIISQLKEDIHRAVPKGLNLDKILCIRTERTVRNDNTLSHNKKLYQLKEAFPQKSKVVVQERVDGSMLITYQGVSVKFREITERPEKQQKPKKIARIQKPPIIPADHPWRVSKNLLFERQKLRKQLKKVAA